MSSDPVPGQPRIARAGSVYRFSHDPSHRHAPSLTDRVSAPPGLLPAAPIRIVGLAASFRHNASSGESTNGVEVA